MAEDKNKWLKEANRLLKEEAEIRQKISSSVEGYLQGLKDLKQIQETIKSNQEKQKEIQAKILELEKDKTLEGRKALRLEKAKLGVLEDETKEYERQGAVLADNLKNVNKGNLLAAKAAGGLVKTFAKLPDLADGLRQRIQNLGIVDMDKAIRKSALSMGVLSKQFDGFYNTVEKTAQYTNELGIGIEELAKMQADYSEELGRNVMLGESGLKSIAKIAAATNLGAEGATKLAADFDNMGLSAERTAEYTEQIMNDSHGLGLNASKVVKNLSQNMKMLNKYNFKNGVKGLAKMAETSAKLGVDMNMVSGMADKLFDIEGAVDMSAQLQVMGGEWAKLADPFKLMYMARNDMEGLMEAVGGAAAASAKFNSKTKEFEISAMEMHRLRKIAEQTGVSYEELAQAGKNAAKFSKIKTQIGFNLGSGKDGKAMQEFIANTAKFNEQGKAVIELNGEPKLVSQLTSADRTALKAQIEEKKNLEERAKSAQNFDDQIKILINQLKTAALPLVKSLNEELIPRFKKLMKTLVEDGWLDNIKSIAKDFGSIIGKVAGWFVDNPKLTLGLIGFGKAASFLIDKWQWFQNGKMLAQGFLSGTGGGSFLSGLMDMIPGMGKKSGGRGGRGGRGGGGGFMKDYKGLRAMGDTRMGALKSATKWNFGGRGGVLGKLGKTGAKVATGAGKLATGAASLGAGFLGDWAGGKISNSLGYDDTTSGDIGSTIGSIVLGGLGTFLGPAGTIAGAGLGAALGKTIGDWIGTDTEKKDEMKKWGLHDGLIGGSDFNKGRGVIQGGKITPIDNKDDLIAMKKDGPIHKTMTQGTDSKLKVEFGEIRFKFDELKITAPGTPGTAIELTKDPQFIRSITRMIHSETEKVINGGMNKG